jgi:hypothetical protein
VYYSLTLVGGAIASLTLSSGIHAEAYAGGWGFELKPPFDGLYITTYFPSMASRTRPLCLPGQTVRIER